MLYIKLFLSFCKITYLYIPPYRPSLLVHFHSFNKMWPNTVLIAYYTIYYTTFTLCLVGTVPKYDIQYGETTLFCSTIIVQELTWQVK